MTNPLNIYIGKNPIKSLLLVMLCFFAFSCKGPSSQRKIDATIQLLEVSRFEHVQGEGLRLWANDTLIYVSNAPENGIYCYNFQGKSIKTLGKSGEAPWEFGTIWSFSMDADNKSYWVQDYPKQLLKRYAFPQDTLISYHNVDLQGNTLFLGNGKTLVTLEDSSDNSYHIALLDLYTQKYSNNINVCALSGDYTGKINPNLAWSLQGNFCKNSRKSSAYYFKNTGAFVILDSLGNGKFFKDVRNQPMPQTIVSDGMGHVKPQNCGSLSGCMDDIHLFLLTPRRNEIKWRKVEEMQIDLYKLDGAYVNSFAVPNSNGEIPIHIAKTTGQLVVYYKDGTIVIYKCDVI